MRTLKRTRFMSVLLSASLIGLQVSPAQAEMVPTEQAQPVGKADADRAKVKAFASRADVQEKLQALGVTPESSKARVDALTDAEVATLASRIDSLPAGGTLSQTDLLLVLLIAILVAIII